jgi:hypothetical protein
MKDCWNRNRFLAKAAVLKVYEQILWVLLNTSEFSLNH